MPVLWDWARRSNTCRALVLTPSKSRKPSASEGIRDIQGLHIIGPADARLRGGIVTFYIDGIDSHRIALMIDQMAGILVRSGQHCAHSWFNAHHLQGSVRASFYFYNTLEEVELFVASLKKIRKVL
jgi:cysteine desulfurase/selenocysteine lyase